MSLDSNKRRLAKKAKKKGTEVPMVNLHIAHKKARKYGTGVIYSQGAGTTNVMGGNSD